jgi:DNA-binding beta-propeller fold protein YncE
MSTRRLGALFLFLTATASAGLLAAGRTSGATLLVLSKQDHTLAIVDPESLRVEARVPVGDDPHEVIASTDGTTAYVSNYGFGRYNTLAVIDLAARKPLAPVDLGPLRGPHGLAFVQGKVWFTAEAAKAIASYDPEAGKVDWIMGTGQNRTHMIYVFPDARRIVTTNVNSGTVLVLDRIDVPGGAPRPGDPAVPGYPQGAILPPGGDWLPTVIPVGQRDEGFDVSPDGTEAWIANAGDGTISVIDLGRKKVVATLDADVRGANRLRFTPDGKMVLVSLISNPDLVVLDTRTRTTVKRLPIGHGAAGILVEPGGERAFVSCSPDGYVAVVDLRSLEVVGKIQAGGNPDGLAWAVER